MSQENTTETEKIEKKSPSFLNPKLFIIGLPLFAIQLVAVYFITANILLSKVNDSVEQKKTEKPAEQEDTAQQQEPGKFMFAIEDIIVNPAGTDGKRLLLTSVGFDLTTEEEKKILEAKEIIVKDVIISTLSSKNLAQLSNGDYKDTLKLEIGKQLRGMIPNVKLNKVYLSKYIIQ